MLGACAISEHIYAPFPCETTLKLIFINNEPHCVFHFLRAETIRVWHITFMHPHSYTNVWRMFVNNSNNNSTASSNNFYLLCLTNCWSIYFRPPMFFCSLPRIAWCLFKGGDNSRVASYQGNAVS